MWAGIPDQFLSSYIASYFGLSTIFCFSGFAENALDMNCKSCAVEQGKFSPLGHCLESKELKVPS